MNDGGPAFPRSSFYGDDESPERYDTEGDDGMSLRDWFAGMVISPMLVQAYGQTPDVLASTAFAIADAMIWERAKDRVNEKPAVPKT